MLRSAFTFVLDHRRLVLLVCVLISALAAASASRLVVASSIGQLFLDEEPRYPRYQELTREFGSDEFFLIAYDDASPLRSASLERLEQVRDRLLAWPEVERVHSLLDAVELRGVDGALEVRSYADAAREGDPGRAWQALLADPDYRGTLLASDGSGAAVLIELEVDPYRPAERGPALVGEALDAFVAAGYPRQDLHRAGFSAVVSEVMQQSVINMQRLFPLSALALLLTVLALFRRLAPALMAMGVALVAVLWTIGFSALLDRHFSIFTAMVPSAILTVAFSDIVHLWSAYLLELKRGASRREAILAISEEVGSACLLTSVTTFVGFLSLSAVPTPVSRLLGVTLGFGVGMALLLAVTLVPVLLSYMAVPDQRRDDPVQRWLDRTVRGAARLSTRRAGLVVAVFGLTLIPISYGVATFSMEADFAKRFPETSEFGLDQRYVSERYAGTTTVDVFIHAPEPGGLLPTERFASVAALQDALEALPEVDAVSSPVDLVRALHGALAPSESGQLPTEPHAIAQHLLLLEMAEGGDTASDALDRQLDFERQQLRMVVRAASAGFRAAGHLGERAEELAREHLDPELDFEVTGLGYLLGSAFNHIVRGQRNALLLSLVVIALIMAAGLRSIRVGAVSMLPNLLPVAALIAWSSWRWDPVDTDILIVAVMAIGIGVDDTIHFLMRLRIESQRPTDLPPDEATTAAIGRSFDYAGRGIVMTTILLCAGFLPFAASDYFTIHVIGAGLPLTLVVALLADLFLVPAMVKLGWLKMA